MLHRLGLKHCQIESAPLSKISSDRLPILGWKSLTAMGLGLLMLSGCAGAPSGDSAASSSAPAPSISSEEPTSAPSAEAAALLKDFEGKTCDGDELIMDQGDESLYCDLDANGSLIWVTAVTHKLLLDEAQAKAQAKVEADAKAETEKKAKDEAEAKTKREAKAAAEKKELKLTKAAPQTSAAKPSVQGFVAPKPQPKATPTPKPKPKATPKPTPKSQGSAYYKNCTAVRAAGKAPIYAGEPGYSRKLDRDGDGEACE